jgi:glycosyl transferase, family 25
MKMVAQLDALGLSHQIVNAVDGRLLSAEQLALRYDADRARVAYRAMTPGEIGCALSHAYVYKEMLRQGQTYALILEDDALLNQDVPNVLNELVRSIDPSEPVVVLLSHVNKYVKLGNKALGSSHTLVRPYAYWWLAHGYFLTKAAAANLDQHLHPIWTAADSWRSFESLGLVKMYAVVPYCIGLSELAAQSNLESDRRSLQFVDEINRSWTYYLKKYCYDRFIFQIFVRPFLRVKNQKAIW